MKCTGCNFETDDPAMLAIHLITCESKPEEKWLSYIEYGTEPVPFKNSDILEENND